MVLINKCVYLEALRKQKASVSCKVYMFSLCVVPSSAPRPPGLNFQNVYSSVCYSAG